MFKDSTVMVVFGSWRKNSSVITFQIMKKNKNPTLFMYSSWSFFFFHIKSIDY